MAIIKGQAITAFLNNPLAKIGNGGTLALLIFGPDAGLVHERGQQVLKFLEKQLDDPMATSAFSGEELQGEPDRIFIELATQSLFGGQRIVYVKGDYAQLGPALKGAFDQPCANHLIIEAGNMTPRAPLRKLFEAGQHTICLPCYADSDADIARLIQDEVARHGLTITPDAARLLKDNIGSDRAISRSEIDKLCLYAAQKSQITPDDILAVIGDSAMLAIDDLIDATAGGDFALMDIALQRLKRAGNTTSTLAIMVQNHFARLESMRAAIDAGQPANMVIKSARPPIFYKRTTTIERQLRLWSATALRRANARINAAILEGRQNPDLAVSSLDHALLAICAGAARN